MAHQDDEKRKKKVIQAAVFRHDIAQRGRSWTRKSGRPLSETWPQDQRQTMRPVQSLVIFYYKTQIKTMTI